MIKKIVKKIFRKLGFEITRYRREEKVEPAKTIRTESLTLYETKTGKYFLPTDAKADVVASAIIKGEIFEKEVVELASRYIKKGSTVLDLGANFGQMSILFSNFAGDTGHVFSFDADDFVFAILKKNIHANNKEKNITPIFGAVHSEPNKSLFFPVQDFKEFNTYGSYGIDYNSQLGREVKTLTIDSLNIESPISFMKIDIQGGDLEAMKGAVRTIQRNKMPILFEYEYHFEDRFNFKFQHYVDFVDEIGYKFEKVLNGHNFLIIPA